MKKKIILVLVALFTIGLIYNASDVLYYARKIVYRGEYNWYEIHSQEEIQKGNELVQEKLKNKYNISLNNVFIDVGYKWDEKIYIPILDIGNSLNWTEEWLPEENKIKLTKNDDTAIIEIVNFFGKAYAELDQIKNELKISKVEVSEKEVNLHTNASQMNNINSKKVKKLNFYINDMKMTESAVEYKGKRYVPSEVFAKCFGKFYRYDADLGVSAIGYEKLETIYVDKRAYSSLEELGKLINLENVKLEYKEQSKEKEKVLSPIYKGGDEKLVALSFDDYLGEKVIPLLNVLDNYHVKANFFTIGNSLKQNQSIAKKIVEKGHCLQNHTWSHVNAYTLTDDELRAELIATNLAITKYTGQKPILYRPPGGFYTENMLKIAGDTGLRTILWSINSTDANPLCSEHDIEKVVTRWINDGSIIAMHTNNEETIKALPQIIEYLQRSGYKIVTIPELLAREK